MGTQTVSCFEGGAESFVLSAGYCRIGISRLGLDTIVLDDVLYLSVTAQHVLFIYRCLHYSLELNT